MRVRSCGKLVWVAKHTCTPSRLHYVYNETSTTPLLYYYNMKNESKEKGRATLLCKPIQLMSVNLFFIISVHPRLHLLRAHLQRGRGGLRRLRHLPHPRAALAGQPPQVRPGRFGVARVGAGRVLELVGLVALELVGSFHRPRMVPRFGAGRVLELVVLVVLEFLPRCLKTG